MSRPPLEVAFRAAGGRVIAALAARYRDLNLAEDAFAESCARAAAHWRGAEVPADPAAWLYRTADRVALDLIRKRRVRERTVPDMPEPQPNAEEAMTSDAAIIPDERLRLIFVCCHPAVAAEARAALTLRLVCGLSAEEIARAFLLPVPTLAQRLTRAKHKIAAAGVAFEVPGPQAWGERLEAVLSTLEVAYSKAHEDAAGAGPHAGYAREMMDLTGLLARLLPHESEVQALAATLRFAEARRPARLAEDGAMVPLSLQNPARWDRQLIEEGERHVRAALAAGLSRPRIVQAAIHRSWCARRSLDEPAPWPAILALYDGLLELRDDPIVRLNRAVALAEVEGAAAALIEVERLDCAGMDAFLPLHAVRADLFRRIGDHRRARAAYDAALALGPGPAEALWLRRQRDALPALRSAAER